MFLRALRSVRFRITLLFVLIFGAILVTFSGFLYHRFLKTQQSEFDASLYNFAVDLNQAIELNFFGGLSVDRWSALDPAKVRPFALGKALFQISRMNGDSMLRSWQAPGISLPLTDVEIKTVAAGETLMRDIDATVIFGAKGKDLAAYRVLTARIGRTTLEPLVLQAAVPTTFLEVQRRDLRNFFLVSVPSLILAAFLGGWFISNRALRPVGVILHNARAIGPADLKARIPLPANDDELRQLALTLNALFARLQQAFESQERFVSDASHQLKTPLTVMRTELDLLRSSDRPPEQVDAFLESAGQEISYLSRLVEDLLLLARVDSGVGALAMARVRLDELVLEAVSRLERFAQLQRVRLTVNLDEETGTIPDFETEGDPDLLRCLFQNLIENAVKFSPAGESVDIRLHAEANRLICSVTDRGPGMDAETQSKIFQRFYSVRSPGLNPTGTGLGLAIASRIASVHDARLEVESQVGRGSTFRVHMKKL
ncbi:MAG: HAMP domain-containing histidine kinase [Bdellovibrionales bacterium]|nr:HAMP domain-containing histidine kinase [Bdellovibrionales bacterium]